MYKHILIPIDGSSCSELAIHQGLSLAKSVNARVTFMYVLEDPIIRGHTASKIPSYVKEFYEHDKQLGQDTLKQAMQVAEIKDCHTESFAGS